MREKVLYFSSDQIIFKWALTQCKYRLYYPKLTRQRQMIISTFHVISSIVYTTTNPKTVTAGETQKKVEKHATKYGKWPQIRIW